MQKRQATAFVVCAIVLALTVVSADAAGKTVTIRVEGMHCGGCAASIEKKLKATEGVEEVRVSYEKKEAWIKFDDQKVSEAKLREVINSTGFKAVEEKSASAKEGDESCCASGAGCCTGGSCSEGGITRQ